jgi:hypothetical protein
MGGVPEVGHPEPNWPRPKGRGWRQKAASGAACTPPSSAGTCTDTTGAAIRAASDAPGPGPFALIRVQRLKLVALEYMVPAEDWHRLHRAPPTFKGQPFDDHRKPALRHGIPFGHYDLHVWLYRTNPAGIFAPFNPEVSCRLAAPAPAGSHSH